MTFPAFIFGFFLASLLGALFHLWKNGGIGHLALYLVLSWAGFVGGHLLADVLEWPFIMVGPLNVGMGVVGSILFLFVGHWLSLVQIDTKGR